MKTFWGYLTVALLLVGCAQRRPRGEEQSGLEAADGLFESGKFAEASSAYEAELKRNPQSLRAGLRLGQIALLSNRFAEAEQRLNEAARLDADNSEPKKLLAELYYRQDDFQKAAQWLRAIGSDSFAARLASFRAAKPYELDGPGDLVRIPFTSTDPLPLVTVGINGSPPANFLVDTGGGELVLDPEFAKEVQAKEFGAKTGTFAGGQQAQVVYATVESVELGAWRLRNVPVHLLPTRRLSRIFPGKRIDGIVGTIFLYHFVSTLDYPRGELVLRRLRSSSALAELASLEKSSIAVPFWLASDHEMVAWGRVNSLPCLMFVDTGLAGMGFTAPGSTVKEAGIAVDEQNAFEGLGGAGKVKAVPFVVNELSLGGAQARNITGVLGPFPPSLERSAGFRICGLISHSFFRPFAVTLDFTGMRMFLSPAKARE